MDLVSEGLHFENQRLFRILRKQSWERARLMQSFLRLKRLWHAVAFFEGPPVSAQASRLEPWRVEARAGAGTWDRVGTRNFSILDSPRMSTYSLSRKEGLRFLLEGDLP